MGNKEFDREDRAFLKLEKAVERLFDLGFSGSAIMKAVSVRFNELAHPDYISQQAEDQAIDRTCACDASEPAPEVTGWCDACGEEVTDPESVCSARDDGQVDNGQVVAEWAYESIHELFKRVKVLEDNALIRKMVTINHPPYRQPYVQHPQPIPYVQPLTTPHPQWSPQFGMGGGTSQPLPQRPQTTCGNPHCHMTDVHSH